jgi:hypothetical protein
MSALAVVYANEVDALSHYLVGQPCRAEVAADYALAVSKLNIILTEQQAATYQKMLRSSLYMRAIDGGLAFTNPQSLLRKRIFTMLCLLEATPHYTQYFLPQKRSWLYFFGIGFKVAYAFFTAIIGVIIIKLSKIE